MLDLQKLVLRRLLDSQDTALFSKLVPKYFTSSNLILFGKIEHFYKNNLKLPNIDEFGLVKKEVSLQDYYDTQILNEGNQNDNIESDFLVDQLQDFCIRDETIVFLDEFLDELEDLEKIEIIDKFQEHLMELNRTIPISDELVDIGKLEVIPSMDTFVLFPSGLSAEYDAINGGFALQELIGIGGRRGSGKSILALNIAINRFLMGHTAAYFSIEMRYLEIYYRAISILSRVPFLDIYKNILTNEQKIKIARTKVETFYKDTQLIRDILGQFEESNNLIRFDTRLKAEKPEMKENRFFIIDDPVLTLNRIDHYCNLFGNKYPDFTLSAVDYLNIISVPDSKDWKVQIQVAEDLKRIARKYNQTVISPYQVDQTLEARYAKGILDAVDRAFTFVPKQPDDEDFDVLTLYTAKIRNGKNITFDIGMDWENVRVDPTRATSKLNQDSKLQKGAQFGTGNKEENDRDL